VDEQVRQNAHKSYAGIMTDSHRKWIAIATGVVALLAVGSQFLSGQALPPSPLVATPVLPVLGATSVQPNILSPGESTSSNLTFTSSQSLTNVTLRVVPQIAPFLTVQPSSISSAPANQTQSVQLSFAISPTAVLGTYDGTLQLKSGTTTFPQTVKVVVNVWGRLSSAAVGVSLLFPPTWTVSTVSNAQGTSVYVHENSEEFPGEGITVTKSNLTREAVLNDLNSSFQLLGQTEESFNGQTWTIYTFNETLTGQQFIAAFSTSAGVLYEVGGKANPAVNQLFLTLLSTVTFL